MPIDSVSKLLSVLKGLLPADQEREAAAHLSKKWTDPKALAKELLKRGWLTLYQATRIFQDQAARLRLGPYVLLDLLGEGGMGQAASGGLDRTVRVWALPK